MISFLSDAGEARVTDIATRLNVYRGAISTTREMMYTY
jgi:hypothetical protein